jgi:transcriptional regulator with XRE-family HTH domain
MNPEQNPTGNKREQARNLYFQTNLTQKQIADVIGVSQKTVSTYVSDHKWNLIKKRAGQLPAIFIEQMYTELQALNDTIAARGNGQCYATPEEAEVRRKILYSIAAVKDRQSAGTHAEVLLNFMACVAHESQDDARILIRYVDRYLIGEMNIKDTEPIQPYNLPNGTGTATPLQPGNNQIND